MAYRPQSGEAQFLAFFTQRRPEIEAYKRQHGGDLEGAFQRVTGTPWPEGRSVKIHDGVPEMTKDRTVKSVLGKYVAPIGAGALTALTLGGAAPALAGLFGGGGAAAGGAAAGGAGATAAGLTVPSLIKGALPIAGAILKGREQTRQQENTQNVQQDQTRFRAAEFNRENPRARGGAAAYGDTLANVQDYQLQGRGRNLSSAGGLRPSLLSPGTRQLGTDISREAVLSQLARGTGANDPYGTFTPTPVQRGGGADTALTALSLAGPALGSLLDRYGRPMRRDPSVMPDDEELY